MARKPKTRTYAQKLAKAPSAAHHLLTPSAYSTSPKGRGPWTVLSTNRVPRVNLRKRVAELRAEAPQLTVNRPELVPPFHDAMRFIHREERHRNAGADEQPHERD